MSTEQVSAVFEILAFLFLTSELLLHPVFTRMLGWLPLPSSKFLFGVGVTFAILLCLFVLVRKTILPFDSDHELNMWRLIIASPLLFVVIQAGIIFALACLRYLIFKLRGGGVSKGGFLLIGSGLFILSKLLLIFF